MVDGGEGDDGRRRAGERVTGEAYLSKATGSTRLDERDDER